MTCIGWIWIQAKRIQLSSIISRFEIFNTYLVAGNTLWYSDEDGNPIEDAFVGVNQEGYENYGYTDSSGSLTLYLSEGEFEFTSRALGYYDSRECFRFL